MKFLLLVVGISALLCGGSYFYVQAHPEVLPTAWKPQFDHLRQQVNELTEQAKARFTPPSEPAPPTAPHKTSKAPSSSASAKHPTSSTKSHATPHTKSTGAPAAAPKPPAPLKNPMTLYLTNGGIVTGEFVTETPQQVVLRWEYGDVGFQRAEIQRVVKGKQDTGDDHVTMPWEGEAKKIHWPYHSDVVVKLMKGTVVDANITSVTPQALILTQTLSGGGQIEHTIARKDIEQLMFRPIRNERSERIEQNLKSLLDTLLTPDAQPNS